MPIVRVEFLAGRSQETKQKIAEEITATIVRHAGSEPPHVYVIFDDVAPNNWAVGGQFFKPAASPGGQI